MKTETKHTPGPWIVSSVGDIAGHYAAVIAGPKEEGHPTVCSLEFDDVDTLGQETRANAELISRAPDLLRDRDALQARVTALEAALAWAESTAVNLYCALQSTAHMDPNDRRIPTITGQVVLDLIVVRDRAREALSPAQPEGEVRK